MEFGRNLVIFSVTSQSRLDRAQEVYGESVVIHDSAGRNSVVHTDYTNLAGTRVGYNFSPRIFAQSLIQYNDSDELWSVNFRFGWLQDANTGLFLVYNETEGIGEFIPPGARAPTELLTTS